MCKNLYENYKKIWWNKENSLDTLYSFIKNYNIDVDSAGNITVTNSKSEDVPVFCCHLDTVHSDKPYPYLLKDDILLSMNSEGIGGDDKCGVVACLELLKKINCKVVFFREEETGCVGAKKYNQETLKKNRFMIEIDRRGSSDLIFNGHYLEANLASDEFIEDVSVLGEKFGFNPEKGLYTDVSHLRETGISRMNISCGYYLPHTAKEYVVLSELQNTIDLCYTIGKKLTKQYKHKAEVYKIAGYEGTLLFGEGEYGEEIKENDTYRPK